MLHFCCSVRAVPPSCSRRDVQRSYSERLGLAASDMLQGLWGQSFYSSRTKTVISNGGGGRVTMFEQFLLQPIWDVYSAVLSGDAEAASKIVSRLKLNVTAKDVQHKDRRIALQSIMSAWVSISPPHLQPRASSIESVCRCPWRRPCCRCAVTTCSVRKKRNGTGCRCCSLTPHYCFR